MSIFVMSQVTKKTATKEGYKMSESLPDEVED